MLKQDPVLPAEDTAAFVRDASYLGWLLINTAAIRAFSFLTSRARPSTGFCRMHVKAGVDVGWEG